MHKVVEDVSALECGLEAVRVQEVGTDHLDLVAPRHVAELVRVAYHAPDLVSGVQQLRDESSADVAAGAGHHAQHVFSPSQQEPPARTARRFYDHSVVLRVDDVIARGRSAWNL